MADEDFIHHFGKPSAITKRVFIGTKRQAYDKEMLKELGITHICCCLSGGMMDTDCKFRRFPMDDRGYSKLEEGIFASAFKFLNKAMNENEDNKVLIHCKSGVNRSNTLTIGFLMEFQNITLKEAYEMVKEGRPMTCLHDDYAKQLIEFDINKFGKSSIKYEQMETTLQLCARIQMEEEEDHQMY